MLNVNNLQIIVDQQDITLWFLSIVVQWIWQITSLPKKILAQMFGGKCIHFYINVTS